MAKTTKRWFTDEFKREAVALWETSGRTQAEIARDLGIMPTMLRRWQRGLGVNSGKPAAQPPTSTMASPADQASEIARLRRELDRTRMDRYCIDDLAAWLPLGRRCFATAHDPATAQMRHEFTLQHTASLDEQAFVDRLMRHLHRPFIAVLGP
jgi:transposase